ncbi:hypothetical protein U8607_08285 [Methylobacterium durans]|uniref:hypothetical protein n=1 Tax=Methylobacterium durans TaxID=2202825 RepID=UPI002AFE0DBF|nr:hypothetical protein [Methylobacterium durans]MEA1832079.1 hypothetical protein [Methylobacterium durans]
MKTRLAIHTLLLALGAAVPVSAASAYGLPGYGERAAPRLPFEEPRPGATRPTYGASPYGRCIPSSASEGNANQQSRPVKQYGQTSGGSAC